MNTNAGRSSRSQQKVIYLYGTQHQKVHLSFFNVVKSSVLQGNEQTTMKITASSDLVFLCEPEK